MKSSLTFSALTLASLTNAETPTEFQAAALVKQLVNRETDGSMITRLYEDRIPEEYWAYPFGQVELVASDCTQQIGGEKSGSILIFSSPMTSTLKSVLEHENQLTFDLRDTKSDFPLENSMMRHRVSILGYLEMDLPVRPRRNSNVTDPEYDAIAKCYFEKNPVAKSWEIMSVGAHAFKFYRFIPTQMHYVGGFGGSHYIGWLDVDKYQKAPETAMCMDWGDACVAAAEDEGIERCCPVNLDNKMHACCMELEKQYDFNTTTTTTTTSVEPVTTQEPATTEAPEPFTSCEEPSFPICEVSIDGTENCHCTHSCAMRGPGPYENGLEHCSICSNQPWYPSIPYLCEVCETGYTTLNEFVLELPKNKVGIKIQHAPEKVQQLARKVLKMTSSDPWPVTLYVVSSCVIMPFKNSDEHQIGKCSELGIEASHSCSECEILSEETLSAKYSCSKCENPNSAQICGKMSSDDFYECDCSDSTSCEIKNCEFCGEAEVNEVGKCEVCKLGYSTVHYEDGRWDECRKIEDEVATDAPENSAAFLKFAWFLVIMSKLI